MRVLLCALEGRFRSIPHRVSGATHGGWEKNRRLWATYRPETFWKEMTAGNGVPRRRNRTNQETMKRLTNLSIVAAVAVFLLSESAFAFTLAYDASLGTLPSAQGWTHVLSDPAPDDGLDETNYTVSGESSLKETREGQTLTLKIFRCMNPLV